MKTIFVLIFAVYGHANHKLVMSYDPPYYESLEKCGQAGLMMSSQLINDEGFSIDDIHFVCIQSIEHPE